MNIDTTTYNKAAAYPVDHGYDLRTGAPTTIVVHSTEGGVGQTLSSAATYLFTRADVSAHFLIGRAGEIIQFLDTRKYSAWHAGKAQTAYTNQHSIGIECLHASGESWPVVQKDALAWLLKALMATHAIPVTSIETHGQIALAGPYDRKKDPTNWSYPDFIAWRNALVTRSYRVLGLPVYQRSDHSGQLWGHLMPGQMIEIDDVSNGHIARVDGQPATIGFIRLDPDTLEAI